MGGRDKKAYLLVPEHMIDTVKLELPGYLYNIKNWNVHPNQSNKTNQHDAEQTT
jgi:hypothetical protein